MSDLNLSDLLHVLETVEEAIVVYDANGGLVYWNEQFKTLYRYKDEHLFPGQHYSELGRIDIDTGNVAVGDAYGTGEDYLARKCEYRRNLEGSFTVQMKDNRWIKTTDRRLPNGGFVSVQTDVTHLHLLQSDLEQQVATEAAKRMEVASKLLAANQIIEFGHLSAGYAHDLNNMLMVLETNTELLLADEAISDGQTKILSRVENALIQSKMITQAMLNETTQNRKYEKINVVKCVSDTLDLFRSTSRCPIIWDPILEEGELIILGSNLEFVQILLNLLVNASDAVPALDGQIEVSLDIMPATAAFENVLGVLDPDFDHVVLRVADNGSGIDPETRQNVFTPYFTTKGANGTGLGLAVIARILENNQGGLNLFSEVGKGTVFEIYWPSNGFAPDLCVLSERKIAR